MNLYASTLADVTPAPAGTAVAGISVSPSKVVVFTATPCSAETRTKPVSFCVSNGCTAAMATVFGNSLSVLESSTCTEHAPSVRSLSITSSTRFSPSVLSVCCTTFFPITESTT